MVDPDLVDGWRRDESAPLEGWDFSYLEDRTREEREPWDYLNLARDLVAESESVLDMGTGGGERFAALAPFPGRAVALEGFEPNVSVARGRLHPLGVSVIEADESSTLPFDNGEFDLVLNRHSAFLADEVRRVLTPGGRLLTQQVGGDDLHDLAALFDSGRNVEAWSLTEAVAVIENSGLVVSYQDEWRGAIEFLDVGAIAYLLRAVPWIVADFSVDRYESQLHRLQRRLEMGKPLRFTRTSFVVEAHTPSL
mgnify:CR=1 FL=1